MAKGDLLQSDTESLTGNPTCDLGSNPTSGSLLIFASSVSGSTNTVSVAPGDGFTLLQNQDNSSAGASGVYYKISDGDEQTVSITWSGGSGTHTYLEIDMDGETLDSIQSVEENENLGTHVTSQDTGAITPSQSTNVVVAFCYTNDQTDMETGRSWTGTETTYKTMNQNGFGGTGFDIVGYTDQSGSTEFTFSCTDTGSDAWGVLVVANIAGGGGSSIAAIMHHRRTMGMS